MKSLLNKKANVIPTIENPIVKTFGISHYLRKEEMNIFRWKAIAILLKHGYLVLKHKTDSRSYVIPSEKGKPYIIADGCNMNPLFIDSEIHTILSIIRNEVLSCH